MVQRKGQTMSAWGFFAFSGNQSRPAFSNATYGLSSLQTKLKELLMQHNQGLAAQFVYELHPLLDSVVSFRSINVEQNRVLAEWACLQTVTP